VLFVLGLSALVAPLLVSQQLVRLDVPLMIVVSATLLLMALDGALDRREGTILLASSVAYVLLLIRISQREADTVRREYESAYGASPRRAGANWPLHVLMVLLGLGLLVVGARWLVDGAVAIAEALGVSQLIIGLTIIAAGTSLPEVATSVIAGLRGERDIAVGNVVGSNLFNILVVLGSAAFIAPNGISVAQAAIKLDIPLMLATAVLCLPIFFVNYRIGRWEGALFLSYYVFYTFYLILKAAEHDALTQFFYPMMAIVIPLTVATVTLIFVRELVRRARAHRHGAH
jgi:cation:H+ antiporter